MTCGLDAVLPKMDFIGNFRYVSEHSKLLLQRINAWDTYGKTFAASGGTGSMCSIKPPPPYDPSTIANTTGTRRRRTRVQRLPPRYGFNQGSGRATSYSHSSGTNSKMDEYYTPELLHKVRQAYALDYAVWDEISNRTVDDVARGIDLKHVRSYCQSRS